MFFNEVIVLNCDFYIVLTSIYMREGHICYTFVVICFTFVYLYLCLNLLGFSKIGALTIVIISYRKKDFLCPPFWDKQFIKYCNWCRFLNILKGFVGSCIITTKECAPGNGKWCSLPLVVISPSLDLSKNITILGSFFIFSVALPNCLQNLSLSPSLINLTSSFTGYWLFIYLGHQYFIIV